MALSQKEIQATIQLLEARIERVTGKKVTYAEDKTVEINKEKELQEKLETLTGKKVVFEESVANQIKAKHEKLEKLTGKSVVYEKWATSAKVADDKKGMWKGWSLEDLKAERTKLKNKAKHTAADTSRLKELNFAIRAKKGWGKVKESLQRLTEGTWALPKMPEDQQKVDEAIAKLEAFKTEYYNVLGDDEMFNGIDAAVARIKELANVANNNKTPEPTPNGQ